MSAFAPVTAIAVTEENFDDLAYDIGNALEATSLTGLDIETAQPRAHKGIKKFNSGTGRKLAFDIRRTDLCGMSLWPQGHPQAFYFNIGHADADTRIPFPRLKELLDRKRSQSRWVIHNGPFEQTMLHHTVGWDIEDYICTLQMAVSAYGPDEFDLDLFKLTPLGHLAQHVPEMAKVSIPRNANSLAVQNLMSKIVPKELSSPSSWNGYVKELAYGYGLKKAVKSFFNYDMVTYEQVLNGREHMGLLTTAEVVSYGADDAIWAVRLYDRLLAFMLETNPTVVGTFFNQELPTVPLYAECWRDGVRIDAKAVAAKQLELRQLFAEKSRSLKELIYRLLPFPAEPHAGLFAHEDWYAKNHVKYRKLITDWASSDDCEDAFDQAIQLSGSIPAGWMEERGVKNPKALNITHYMPARVLLYDLFRDDKLVIEKGKVQSDADTRGRLRERNLAAGKLLQADVLKELGELGSLQQTEALFVGPYMMLTDPDTGKMYPVLNSKLATRRMAMSQPNATQLTKRGESTYVRSFFLADNDDHVVVSIDFVQIELVLIGEESGDPGFAKCYSSIPFDDLHKLAAAGVLEVSDEEFARLRTGDTTVSPHLLINTKGEAMEPKSAYKYWRTEVGKGANFEFYYSGLLNNLGTRMNWDREKMFEMSEKYAMKFEVANLWRQMVIGDGRATGYTTLPDGHRRVKLEATHAWAEAFRNKFRRYENPDVMWFVELVIKKLARRAGNQAVNSKIQGSNATLTKRSMVGIHRELARRGWGHDKARLMFPVHDEIVASVHRDLVTDYIQLARPIMMNHPDIIKNLKIDCSPSIGRHFQPWSPKVPQGQIELFECPDFDFIPKQFWGNRVPEEHWPRIVDYLFG